MDSKKLFRLATIVFWLAVLALVAMDTVSTEGVRVDVVAHLERARRRKVEPAAQLAGDVGAERSRQGAAEADDGIFAIGQIAQRAQTAGDCGRVGDIEGEVTCVCREGKQDSGLGYGLRCSH